MIGETVKSIIVTYGGCKVPWFRQVLDLDGILLGVHANPIPSEMITGGVGEILVLYSIKLLPNQRRFTDRTLKIIR
jgi:hypothetical protein